MNRKLDSILGFVEKSDSSVNELQVASISKDAPSSNVRLPTSGPVLHSPRKTNLPPSRSLALSPISGGDVALESEAEVQPEKEKPLSSYKQLLQYFLENFPDSFSPVSPASPESQYARDNRTDTSLATKLVLSISAKKGLKKMEEWLAEKREQGKTVFCFPPSKLSSRRGGWYETGESFSLGVAASSQGDFSSLVDSARRSALNSAKVFFSTSEFDHLCKNAFKILEVISFLDWSVGALGRKLKACALQDDQFASLSDVLACIDRSIRDAAMELSSVITLGILKKREVWCSFTTKGVSRSQKSALLFAPLDRKHLFPREIVSEIASTLQQRATQDLLAQSTKKPKPLPSTVARPTTSTEKSQGRPFRGRAPAKSFPRSRGRGRFVPKAIKPSDKK